MTENMPLNGISKCCGFAQMLTPDVPKGVPKRQLENEEKLSGKRDC